MVDYLVFYIFFWFILIINFRFSYSWKNFWKRRWYVHSWLITSPFHAITIRCLCSFSIDITYAHSFFLDWILSLVRYHTFTFVYLKRRKYWVCESFKKDDVMFIPGWFFFHAITISRCFCSFYIDIMYAHIYFINWNLSFSEISYFLLLYTSVYQRECIKSMKSILI